MFGGTSGAIVGPGNSSSSGTTYRIGWNNTTNTFAGRIQNDGTTTITKVGGGTWILTGANTYSGVTTISGGTLQIGNGGTSGTIGTGSITDNATLAFNRSDSITDTNFGTISGAGNLAKRGTGRLTLSKTHTYSGATTVEAGTLALTNSGSIFNSSNIIISAGALFDVSGTTSGTMILTKRISGFGSVKGNFYVGSRAYLSPGSSNSIGTLTFSNALTLFPNFDNLPCTNIFKITKSPTTNDTARVFGVLTNGGVLVVTNISGNALAAGDSFRLFSAASYSGAFYGFTLPPLTSGLAWDTSTVNTNGIISVVTVPPPVPPFIGGINLFNTNLVFSGTGAPNSSFYVLASTNVSLPLTQWTRLATNQFDATGNFLFTNPLAPSAPQNFFLLQLP